MITVRSSLLALALALTVAAAAGATIAGAAPEQALADPCSEQVWPAIAPDCLTGNVNEAVRVIPIESPAVRQMRERFAVAFQ